MQQDIEIHRHQLLTALAQSAESLRNAANMVDAFANIVQITPQVGVNPINPMAMYQMFANLQQHAGAVGAPFGAGAPVNANGAIPGQDMKIEEGGKRKRRRGPNGEKKEKKPRDPNKPKRPPSAYLLFQNEVRKEMQERFPTMPYHDLLSKISERWAHMSDEDKKIYNDQTAADKVRFQEEKAAYDAKSNVAINNGYIAPALQAVVAAAAQVASDEEDGSEASAAPAKADGSVDDSDAEGGSGGSDEESEQEEETRKSKRTKAPNSKTGAQQETDKKKKTKKGAAS